jgi:hypothetical protein
MPWNGRGGSAPPSGIPGCSLPPRIPGSGVPGISFGDWWQWLEALAGVPHQPGLGWHALRRKFATELKHVPLKDLCYLGGWKDPQTVLKCYQRPDETTMREALASRKALVIGAES